MVKLSILVMLSRPETTIGMPECTVLRGETLKGLEIDGTMHMLDSRNTPRMLLLCRNFAKRKWLVTFSCVMWWTMRPTTLFELVTMKCMLGMCPSIPVVVLMKQLGFPRQATCLRKAMTPLPMLCLGTP